MKALLGALALAACGLAGALAFALLFPLVRPVLVDPLTFGSPTLAEITGLGKGLPGVLFGVATSAVALALPVHPGAPRPTPARRPASPVASIRG